MFGNILLLTWLCVVWFFSTKARGDVYFTNITRDRYNDIFTNEFCETCAEFGAKIKNHTRRTCICDSEKSDSVFVRSERQCVSGKDLRGK